MHSKIRLDWLLVEKACYKTRSRARDAVARGYVSVNGTVVEKPAYAVSVDDRIEIEDPGKEYVSRAALKLKSGLDKTGFSASGLSCLDIGASTGGFTQILLEQGAKHVFAIDVGHGQLSPLLAGDARVTNIEGLNARDLTSMHLDGKIFECIVCDVSFISLRLVLPPALALAQAGSWGIFLVKPQFEVGREHIGSGGIVRNASVAQACAENMANWLEAQPGWRTTDLFPSPIKGSDGNQEFLLAGIRK
jgi:23S rRNA (cytidine1920-2'-O)/16S rRNA (cytidine1409-2'-O)-methyltransferase